MNGTCMVCRSPLSSPEEFGAHERCPGPPAPIQQGHSHRYYCACLELVAVEEAIKAGDLSPAEGRDELRRVHRAMEIEWRRVWNRNRR